MRTSTHLCRDSWKHKPNLSSGAHAPVCGVGQHPIASMFVSSGQRQEEPFARPDVRDCLGRPTARSSAEPGSALNRSRQQGVNRPSG